MTNPIRKALYAVTLLAFGLTVSGCTPWLETRMSQTERALNCAALSVSAPGASTAQADACAVHPATS